MSRRPAAFSQTEAAVSGSGYSRAVERVDVTVGGFLLDVGCDDGWVWDARGVQTVVGGHHVWGEPRGQKTV